MNYGSAWLYGILQKDLMDWVWNNKTLRWKITEHDLKYLFEFTWQRGLSIDLRRFETGYYKATFYPPDEKKEMIDEFVRKVCIQMGKTLQSLNKDEINLTITVRHMISEASYWHTFYVRADGHAGKPANLSKKENDWYYQFNP